MTGPIRPTGATRARRRLLAWLTAAFAVLLVPTALWASGEEAAQKVTHVRAPAAPRLQPGETVDEQWAFVDKQNAGCVSCHTQSDHKTMHASPAVVLACVDCHGGNGKIMADRSWNKGSMDYVAALKDAHVLPRFPVAWNWPSSANPRRSYTLLAKESPEFIRFVNPSDYRVARDGCGACHMSIIEASERSLMSTGAMLWGGAAYNNGIVPFKNYIFGESFTRKGEPALLKSASKEIGADGKPMWGTVTPAEKARGALPILYPLPRWNTIPPGDVFRVFEDGGRTINPQFPEIGLPNSTGSIQRLEEPGRPDLKQSNRGPATGLRVAIPVLNIHKTRLNDPFLFQMGTNDQPGDYRSSGCASCHVIYANDREPRHSSQFGKCGRDGQTITADPTINGLREGEHRTGAYGSYDAAKQHHEEKVRGTVLGGQGKYLAGDATVPEESADMAGNCARAIASAEQLTFTPAQGVAPHGSMDDHRMDKAEAHAAAGLDAKGHASEQAGGHASDAGGHGPAAGGYVPMQDRERGHPLVHAFTRAIPTAQCMNCHMHQPNIFLNTYLGYIMWDYESDAPRMWPGPENASPRPAGLSDAEWQKAFKRQFNPTMTEQREVLDRNPEGASARGLWRDVEFLRNVYDLNAGNKDTQFADYHGHGWNFRAILKRDRRGNLLDDDGDMTSYGTDTAHIVNPADPEKWRKGAEGKFVEPGYDNPGKSVHMMDIHAQVGMQCADCHFAQDSHGNGLIYGEVANAVEIGCKDCHGTPDAFPTLLTSNLAAPKEGTNLSLLRNADGARRFEWTTENGRRVLLQRSIIDPKLTWRVSLVKESVDPQYQGVVEPDGRPVFNPKAARAKLMGKAAAQDGQYRFGSGIAKEDRAHRDDDMACFTCHLSWTTSCAGCHLPIEANWKSAVHKYEEDYTRNYATYNPQVARDDMFQLGKHQSNKSSGSDPVKFDAAGNPVGGPDGGKAITAPIRSSSALILSSTNINRERIYVQQPPISAIGYSSQAFAPHFPHTVRKQETKQCTDCHLSDRDDNNAIMAQLLLLGTNTVNFVGMNAWTGLAGGFEAVRVTEWDEPQAVIGSYLHRYAYPDFWRQHVDSNGRELKNWTRGAIMDGKLSGETTGREEFTNVTKGTRDAVRCLQMRGEYMFVAEGKGGFRAYDIASVGNKGFSERITTAPFSALGHDTHIGTSNATCMALPTNQAIAPTRNSAELRGVNQEQPFSPIYHYAFVTDAVEGLIAVNVDTLADGEFRNNFFERALTFNPDGVLTGARHITLAGDYAYIVTDKALVTVHLPAAWSPAQPCEVTAKSTCLNPSITSVVPLRDPRATAMQFRYLWVTTANGLELMDVTNLAEPKPVPQATVPLADARRVYVARTYAYVAAKAQGLVIVDITAPTRPAIYQQFTAGGQLNDAEDVIVASTNASLFAYVADGRNGMKVLQLTSPDSQPNFYGFAPEPKPELIAWVRTPSPALAMSKGLDRDRGVDETGGQIAVFGRLGSRPFNRKEMEQLFLDSRGQPFKVNNAVDMKLWVGAKTAPQLMVPRSRMD